MKKTAHIQERQGLTKCELDGKIPSFFLHLPIRPVLQLFKQRGFDYCKSYSYSAFISDPHESGLGFEPNISLRKIETDVQQSAEAKRLFETVKSHSARAQIDSAHLRLFAFGVAHCHWDLHLRSEEFLLLVADDSECGAAVSRRKVDVVFLQFAAQGPA